MNERVVVRDLDFVHVSVEADPGIISEIREHFTFDVPGARYQPAFRYGHWDGKKRLFKARNNTIYAGLVPEIQRFCETQGYDFINDAPRATGGFKPDDAKLEAFISHLNVPYERREHQIAGFKHIANNHRGVLVSCTASGKSLILYMMARWFDEKTLLVVPRSSLVSQMRDDFISYGCDPNLIHCVEDGVKFSERPIIISTWQALQHEDQEFFAPFRVLLGDEAHLWKATSLAGIMEKLTYCPVRVSVTGTLDGTKTHRMVLEGLFGPVHEVATTREMIDAGYVSDVDIKCITLVHSEEARRKFYEENCVVIRGSTGRKRTKPPEYDSEITFLVDCEVRNAFIRNLALSLKGNTLVLFHHVEEHGLKLHADMVEADPSRKIYLLHGGIKGSKRNKIRKIFAEDTDAIMLASYGVFSTGENVPRIHNLIAGHPWKGKIITMQSLGRGLRTADDKDILNYYDISDDLSHRKKKTVWENHTLGHARERIRHYCEAELNYKLFSIDIAS